MVSSRLWKEPLSTLPLTVAYVQGEDGVQSLIQEDPLKKEMATTPVFLPGKSHGQSNLVWYGPWGHKEQT